MAGIKFECRGYMVPPPKRRKTPCGLPFTTIWGGKQNQALKGGK